MLRQPPGPATSDPMLPFAGSGVYIAKGGEPDWYRTTSYSTIG